MKTHKTRRLFCDIETSYFTAATFSLFPKYIPHDNIIQDWWILCAAWKWEGEPKVFSARTYTKNDVNVVKGLSKAILQADEIVYHNGRKFDWKKLNTRIVQNKLPPIAKPRETDTLVQCRRHFAFTSNRLDYIGKKLTGQGKMHVEQGLWMQALDFRKGANKEAIDKIAEYNVQDVIVLENVFETLKPYIDVGINENVLNDFDGKCPKCNSPALKTRGWCYTKTNRYRRYQCENCFSWSQSGSAERRANPRIR